MAADVLLGHGFDIKLYERMPSLARKFLMAGKSGLNLSHNEDQTLFLSRFGEAETVLAPHINSFTANDIRDWAGQLGINTFVGTSGKIFPTDYKAAPLLRQWVRDLRARGLTTHIRHDWHGWDQMGELQFETPQGHVSEKADATILALGGASWSKLGSNGFWTPYLAKRDVDLAPFRPSNCGFDASWSNAMTQFAGTPIKTVELSFGDTTKRGDLVITETGVEGSTLYQLSARLRDALENEPSAVLHIDLLPDRTEGEIFDRLSQHRGKKSFSTHMQKVLKIRGAKLALLKECTDRTIFSDVSRLANSIKRLPLTLYSTRPIDEAISCAGGVLFSELDENLMIKKIPGLFCAGEMIDWEAPTGGYLLSACFATGRAAGHGVKSYLL